MTKMEKKLSNLLNITSIFNQQFKFYLSPIYQYLNTMLRTWLHMSILVLITTYCFVSKLWKWTKRTIHWFKYEKNAKLHYFIFQKTTCAQSRAEQRSVYKQKFLKTNKKFHYRTEKIVNFQIVNELKELLRKKTNGKLFRTNGKFWKRTDNF